MSDTETAGAAPAEAAVEAATTITPTLSASHRNRLLAVAAKAGIGAAEAERIASTAPTMEAALDKITAAWKEAGGPDGYHVGAPTAVTPGGLRVHMGDDWAGGPGLVKKHADALAALVAPRFGLTHEPTMGREFAAQGAERAKLTMAHQWAALAGERPYSDAEAARVWLSGGMQTTSGYPVIASSAVEVVVARSLEQAPIAVRQCVHVINASDWRARNHWSLSGANKLTDNGEAGQPNHLVIDEKGEALPAPMRKAGFFRASEELIRNAGRSLDLEVALARSMIEAANETQRDVIAAKIVTPGNLSDGTAVFDASRSNVAADPALPDVAALSAARVGLARQVDSQGVLRPVEPAIILVAPEQRTAAEQLVADITAAEVGEVNPFSGRLRVVSDPGLSGAAGAHWYVLPDPVGTDGLALIHLDDMPAPRIESQPSWLQYGMEWRIQWPMAAAWVRPSWFRTEIPGG